MEDNLRCCPGCGNADLSKFRRENLFAVLCNNCGFNAPTESTWNIRPTLPIDKQSLKSYLITTWGFSQITAPLIVDGIVEFLTKEQK